MPNIKAHRLASSQLALWFSFLGGALAWLIHLLLTYGLAEFGCVSKTPDFEFLGVSGLSWLLLAASAGSIALAASAIWVSRRIERGLHPHPTDAPESPSPERYVARAGLIANLVFIVVILVQTVPIFFFLNDC